MHHVLLGIAEQLRYIDPSSPGTYRGLRGPFRRFPAGMDFLFGKSRFCHRTAVWAVGRNLAFFGNFPVFPLLLPARFFILPGCGIVWNYLRLVFFRFGLCCLVGSKKRPVSVAAGIRFIGFSRHDGIPAACFSCRYSAIRPLSTYPNSSPLWGSSVGSAVCGWIVTTTGSI